MTLKRTTPFLLVLVLLLAACSSGTTAETDAPLLQSVAENKQTEATAPQPATSHEAVVDEQGAVVVAVTPVNLEETGTDALAFAVEMNTHSVDLGMDLAALATLTMDNGRQVTAAIWDAQPGGHHVSGILSFPTQVEGTPLLDGASQINLTIRDVDAAERVFTWQLNG